MGQKETILEAAVDRGRRTLTSEQIVKLLCQVGQLEERNASLEIGFKAISAKCYWRIMGYCDLSCGGRVFCDLTELKSFNFSKLHRDTPSAHTFPIETKPKEDTPITTRSAG